MLDLEHKQEKQALKEKIFSLEMENKTLRD